MQVVVAGHINWDVTFYLDRLPAPDGEATIRRRSETGGGSAANVAVGLASLGAEPYLIGSVGDDDRGVRLRDWLQSAGVNIAEVTTASGATTVKYLLVADSGDVAVLGNNGANEAFSETAPQCFDMADATHLHMTNQPPAFAQALAEQAIDAGLTVSVDPGRRGADRAFEEVIALADLVFAADREATRLFDGQPGEAATADRSIVVTEGRRGATMYTAEQQYHHPGYAVDAVDTSGAGDGFVAGFLSQWLHNAAPTAALAYGNACGAVTTTREGTRTQFDVETLQAQFDLA